MDKSKAQQKEIGVSFADSIALIWMVPGDKRAAQIYLEASKELEEQKNA